VHIVPFAELRTTDLHVDAIYQSGRRGNAGDDPVAALLGVGNQGGFRYRGKIVGKLDVVVLTSSQSDPDWPDTLDRETGVFTYYGDNKKPGRALHETARKGNVLLRRLFEDAHGGEEGRRRVPPIFVFARASGWRDMVFLGLAVPGASDLSLAEDLVAIWRSADNLRFQNYRARFTILDASLIKRAWIESVLSGQPDATLAPSAWQTWVKTGRRLSLRATRSSSTAHAASKFRRILKVWQLLRRCGTISAIGRTRLSIAPRPLHS
jgi:hypothetical protein